MGEVALITGATGFIGSHLTDALLARGARVVAVGSSAASAWRLSAHDDLAFRPLDLNDGDALAELFAETRPDVVYHLASGGVQAGADKSDSTFGVNVIATQAIARLALKQSVRKFVYVGSGFEYLPSANAQAESARLAPVNYYGATKAAASILLEQLCRAEGLPLVICRPFSVYGPRESKSRLIPFVIERALSGETIELTSGYQVRDYVYVSDLVEALLRAEDAPAGSVFNLGSGPQAAYSIRQVVALILEQTGASSEIARFGARVPARPEPQYFVADSTQAQLALRWQPRVAMPEGLAQTIAYYRQARS